MDRPEFSVVLVNWNRADLLVQAVDSVRIDSDASGISVEVIVVDNGSSDESVERICKVSQSVNVIENDTNRGFAAAVNQALDVRQGKHVLLLNTDARLEKGALAVYQEAFQQYPDIGIAGGRLLNVDGSDQNSYSPFPTLLTELGNKSLLRFLSPKRHGRKVDPSTSQPLEVDSVIGAALAIREEALEKIGPLDERFFFFMEETDWCYRARQAGWRVVVLPDARVAHGQGGSSEVALTDVRIEFYRSRYRFFKKHKGMFQTTILFGGMLLKLLVEMIVALVLTVGTLGNSPRAVRRLKVLGLLLGWHLSGCPSKWGLQSDV